MDGKLHQYQALSLKYNQLLSSLEVSEIEKKCIRQELAIIDRFRDDLLWQELADDDKQQKRLISLEKMKRWDSESGGEQISLKYYENVIRLYNQILEATQLIEREGLINIPNIFRLYSILIIEKDLINEKCGFSQMRHMDYYIFMNITDGVKEPKFRKLKNSFHDMYLSWQNRPYQDII